MNVTGDPVQDGFVGVAMETPAGSEVLTTIVTELDVTGLPLTQGAFDVNLQVTTSPLRGE